MTKFAPGAEVPGEFTTALPVAIEVSGDQNEIRRYLKGLADLPRLGRRSALLQGPIGR